MADLMPARNVYPRDILRREMAARNWTADDVVMLAMRRTCYRLHYYDIMRILDDNRRIDERIARGLGMVFDTGPECWMNLQRQADRWEAKHVD